MTYPSHRDVVGTWVCEVFVKAGDEDRTTINRRIFVVSDTGKSRGKGDGLCIASTVLTGGFEVQAHMLLLWLIWNELSTRAVKMQMTEMDLYPMNHRHLPLPQ